jgi:hypothetical protein
MLHENVFIPSLPILPFVFSSKVMNEGLKSPEKVDSLNGNGNAGELSFHILLNVKVPIELKAYGVTFLGKCRMIPFVGPIGSSGSSFPRTRNSFASVFANCSAGFACALAVFLTASIRARKLFSSLSFPSKWTVTPK